MHRSSWIRRYLGVSVVISALLVATGASPGVSAATVGTPDPASANSQATAAQTNEGSDFEVTSDLIEFSESFAEVFVPVGTGPFPAAVTVHGGGYTRGTPADIRPMAELLARQGFVVYNTGYALSMPTRPAFPDAIHDVACAVRLAASHPAADGSVAVVGVSAGAHAGALVALAGDRYGNDCPDTAAAKPSRLVSLGHVDITGRNTVKPPEPDPLFMRPSDEVSPSQWQAADPLNHVTANPGLQALFIHAQDDTITSLAAAQEMIAALTDGGAAADLVVVPGIGHFDLADIEATGEAVIGWLTTNPPG